MDVYSIRTLSTNYVYIIAIDQNCIIVDPGETQPVLEFVKKNKLTPVAVLLTHKHWDHVDGVLGITEVYDIPVYGGKDEEFTLDVTKVDNSFVLLGKEIQIIELRGHTLGAVGYYVEGSLFVGDVLFGAGCGYVFEGTSKDMVESLDKILALPLNTKIYPGHEYTQRNLRFASYLEPKNKKIIDRVLKSVTVPSSLALEIETNPFLRIDEESIISRVDELIKHPVESRVERFACLRRLKTEFDERE